MDPRRARLDEKIRRRRFLRRSETCPYARLIDGELVVESEGGVAEFSPLQADLSDGRLDRFAYHAFDCPYLDGYDLRDAPLIERKEPRSNSSEPTAGAIRYSSHFMEDGKLVLQRACALAGLAPRACNS